MVTPDFNKVNPVRKDSSVSSSDEAERKPPQGDFEKVAKEVDDREKGGSDNGADLKKDKKKVLSDGLVKSALSEDDVPLMSPFQLARGYERNKDDSEREPDIAVAVDLTPKPKETPIFTPDPAVISQAAPAPVANFDTKQVPAETKVNTRYSSIEQADLAEVNTLGNQTQPTSVPPVFAVDASMTVDEPVAVNTPKPLQSIQEVIDQIVEKVYTLKQTGDTQVVVDLKGSFSGSRLIVTESDSAQGQLNITIDNLTGPNQALIEAHKAKIMDALLESGVQVQRFTASTTLESARIDVATDDTKERGGRDNPQQNNQGDGKRQQSNDKS